jgi:hypothetical protein
MKVLGLGSPDDVRVRFDACELDVLVDVVRDLRAKATRDAADTYATTSPRDTRPIDDRHDRLRGLEGLLMQLEEQPTDNRPGAVLMGATPLLRDVAHEGAREALERLNDAHERFADHGHVAITRGAARRSQNGQGVDHDAHGRRAGRPGLGRMMRPSPSAPARATVVGAHQPPAHKLPNGTVARAPRALVAVVFHEIHRERLACVEAILRRLED